MVMDFLIIDLLRCETFYDTTRNQSDSFGQNLLLPRSDKLLQ